MDIDAVLDYLYPDLAGWSVVERNGKQEVTLPEGLKMPTKAEIEQAWKEIQAIREHNRITQEREARYRQETDGLLYDALAKLNLPELKEWQDARERVKKELPYPAKLM